MSEVTFDFGGKKFRIIDFREQVKGERYMFGSGVFTCHEHIWRRRVIVEDVTPPHRTPTDEDAKLRPECEAWDVDYATKEKAVLLMVNMTHPYKFIALREGDTGAYAWKNCRIKNN